MSAGTSTRGTHPGYSLIELLVVILVLGIVAAVTVPCATGVQKCVAAADAASRFTLVLRQVQATAQGDECRMRVRLVDDGSGCVVERIEGTLVSVQQHHIFGGARCSSNFPSGQVEFGAAGRPLLAGTNTPRAGSFVFGAGGGCTVVLQLAGRVRCR